MWATYPKLKEVLDVIDAWGFKYKTIAFQWIKQNKSGDGLFFGLGRWTRGNSEPCLLATKGKLEEALFAGCSDSEDVHCVYDCYGETCEDTFNVDYIDAVKPEEDNQ